jgi:DNA-binding MarR family transcriptional regulator
MTQAPAKPALPAHRPATPVPPTPGPFAPARRGEDSCTNVTAAQNSSDNPLLGVLPAAVALARTLEAETDRALAIVGLTACGFLALRAIRSGRAATQRDLARRIYLEPSTTCELLARLAHRGLLTRRRHGRARPPVLTPAGAALLQRAERLVGRLEDSWALRMRVAYGNGLPAGWIGPIYGLRRWLGEGLAAIAGTAHRGSGAPGAPLRPAGSPAAP